MSGLVESQSIEAEIVACCRAIYWATDAEVALSNWARLRRLTAEKSQAEREQFLRESTGRAGNSTGNW
jgi:hypothetical protein